MSEITVLQKWHNAKDELPIEGREVIALCANDCPKFGDKYVIFPNMYYFKKDTVVEVERDWSEEITYPNKQILSPSQRLMNVVLGKSLDNDLEEIEEDGWYSYDCINDKQLLRYRHIRVPILYWCYPTMPDNSEYDTRASIYA